MVIVDRALRMREDRGEPIRVGLIGAGTMGSAIADQIANHTPGMRLTGVFNRTAARAKNVALRTGAVIFDDPSTLCRDPRVDAIVEATGTIDFGAGVALEAIRSRKHLVLVNAELGATLGPILKAYADRAGVVMTDADGDQPAVIVNLHRFVTTLGLRPVLCGNIKGFQNRHSLPEMMAPYSERWGQPKHMLNSFADGTKISFEQALVANAVEMGVARRGMLGPAVEAGTPVTQAAEWYPMDEIAMGDGVVDYVVGASPAPGVFVIGEERDPERRRMLEYLKMTKGPFYCFYTPYHLCPFEVGISVARAVDFRDAACAPAGEPKVGVVAVAKADLKPGQLLDGIGRELTYGVCENYGAMLSENLLPMGLAAGCRIVRTVPIDSALTFDDVQVPERRLCDRLWAEQREWFAQGAPPEPVPERGRRSEVQRRKVSLRS